MATPSGEVPQMLSSVTSKRRVNGEERAAFLRVRTRPECLEGNLRELTWDNLNCYSQRERGKKKKKRENFLVKSPNLKHCQPAHRTKNCANTRGEIAGCYHMVFTFQFVNMGYHIDWFPYIEESLHPWNEPKLIMVYKLFDVLLNSVC